MGLGIIDMNGDGKQDWVDEMIEMDMIFGDDDGGGKGGGGKPGGSGCCTTTLLCLPFYLLKSIIIRLI